MDKNYDVDTPVVTFKTPAELREVIEFSLPSNPQGLEGVLGLIENTMRYRYHYN
jgi:hypothetical protein